MKPKQVILTAVIAALVVVAVNHYQGAGRGGFSN
jgi:hypothetical protein